MRRLLAEVVVPGTAELGECPVWDEDRGLLLWVDLPTGMIHTFTPAPFTPAPFTPRTPTHGRPPPTPPSTSTSLDPTSSTPSGRTPATPSRASPGSQSSVSPGSARSSPQGPLTEPFAPGLLEGTGRGTSGTVFRARNSGDDPRAGMVTAVAPRRSGGLVVARGDRLTLEPGGVPLGRWELPHDTRFNDGAVDPWGHFWIGTMCTDRPGTAALYRVAPDGRTTTELTGVTCSNGLGWAPDHRTMYYIDTPARTLDAFDVHEGRITGRRVVAEVRGGLPDGLAVDEDGCVWVAVWDGAAVHRYTPEGRLDTVVETPCARPTSCAFGSGTLYVTTAAPDGGSLLAVTGAGGGVPPTPFAG
ncbi:SMP-30/gluconolactonase/LRE family protein [Nonomuraea sp. NPDC055795]